MLTAAELEADRLFFDHIDLVSQDIEAKKRDSSIKLLPLPPRAVTVSTFERLLSVTVDQMQWQGRIIDNSNYTGFSKPFSCTPLEELSPVFLKELSLNKVHSGSYVLGRIISRVSRRIAPSILMEDTNGDVVCFTVYNDSRILDYGSSSSQLDALYPLWSSVVIKEPHFTNLSIPSGANNPGNKLQLNIIRIDSPIDLIFLPPASPFLHNLTWLTPAKLDYSCAKYRALGDEFYKKKDYIVAQFLFTQAIEATPVDSSTKLLPLYRNRSMAAFSVGNFATSARDCKKILGMLQLGTPVPKNDPELRENTLKRLANAQYGQRKFSAALPPLSNSSSNFLRMEQVELELIDARSD